MVDVLGIRHLQLLASSGENGKASGKTTNPQAEDLGKLCSLNLVSKGGLEPPRP